MYLQCTEMGIKPPRAFNWSFIYIYVCTGMRSLFLNQKSFVCAQSPWVFYIRLLEMKIRLRSIFTGFVWVCVCVSEREQVLPRKYVELSLSALEFHCYESNNIYRQIHEMVMHYYTITPFARSHDLFSPHKRILRILLQSIISMLFLLLYPFSRIYLDWNDTITKLQPIKGSAMEKRSVLPD